MANWSLLQETLIDKPVWKRVKHGIHFKQSDGSILANFSGKPCHYQDTDGLWKPIDTKPVLRKDGWFGCPHSDVIIHPDGTVKVGEYAQKADLILAKDGKVDGDCIIREFDGGRQIMRITEDGFRQEIVLDKIPDLKKVTALLDTVSGVLPSKYTASALSAKDSTTAELDDSVSLADAKAMATYLEYAKYPVVIDPDFLSGGTDYRIYGQNAAYATARSDSASYASTTVAVGQRVPSYYNVYRGYVKFDTSSIDDGVTITQVNLKLTVAVDISDADFDVQIAKYDWSEFAGDQTGPREAAYDGALSADLDDSIWRNTSGISANTGYTSGNLSTAWVSKTGATYYALRSKEDSDNSTPTGNEYITLYGGQEATEAYRPVLTVTYTAAGNPHYYYRQL